MMFAEHMSLMLKGGIPLNEAIETLKNASHSRKFRDVLKGILKRVMEGEQLNKAMARYPEVFDQFCQSIIRIGEESGTLDENLKYLSLKLKRDTETNKKVIGAMIYPAMILVVALGISIAIALVVLPKITNMFTFMRIALPLATRILIYSVTFLQHNWLFVISGLSLLIVAISLLRRLRPVRFFLDKLLFSMPVLGKILINFNLAFFSHTFYILMKSSVPLSNSLTIIAQTMPSESYRRKVLGVKGKVEAGERISKSLKSFPSYFPGIFSEMVLTGEKSGSLEESLLYLSDYYEREVDSTIKNLTGFLEPALIIFVGLFTAFTAISIISPIYSLVSQMQLK